MIRARAPWWILAAVSATIAVAAIARWLWAITLDGPVLYGEGAVAHAALLARDRAEYLAGAHYGAVGPIFTAANYPPLYFHVAGLGDPFVVGRIASGVATLSIVFAIAWRARTAGPLIAATLALSWIATLPVVVWGVAVKPDLVALALTVGALLLLERRLPLAAGIVVALAAATKPTELLPAAAFAVALVIEGERRAVTLYAGGFALAAIVTTPLTLGAGDALTHVIDWNALAFHVDQALLLLVVAVIVVGVPFFTAVLTRASLSPILAAYLVASLVIAVLGGREGATINYLLDLVTACFLALAAVAPRLRGALPFPIALAAELVIVAMLFDPFGFVPGRAPGTGAWADPARLAVTRGIAQPALVEDSGLLVAHGVEPVVDDLFLWSRLYDRGGSFVEGRALLDAVTVHRFQTIVSETDLAHLDTAPAFERQRWASALVKIVLDGYRLDRHEGALWVYVPR